MCAWGGRSWLVVGVVAILAAGCGDSSSSHPDASLDGPPSDGNGDAAGGRDGGGDAVDATIDTEAGGASGSDAGDAAGASGSDGGGGQSDGGGGAAGLDAGHDVNGDTADAGPDSALDAMKDVGAPDVSETTQPPGAATALTASVSNRRGSSFLLGWTAPATSWNAPVSSYEVRFARTPITAANFDDTSMVSSAPFAGTPSAPGQSDGVIVKGLDIETDYYFAVAAVDAWGNRGPISATVAPERAVFNVTVLSGMGTDNSGYDLNGAADLGTAGTRAFQPDGLSDLIVGATAAQRVYVFFGTAAGYSTTPSITITGAFTGFGRSVVDAGDLDGDGLDDLAISSPNDNGGRIYIFSRKNPPASWGTTSSWPATLTDTQANYVISSTGLLASSLAGRGLARVGDFDGAGSDDLAIGYSGANSGQGSVVIVKGGASFASRTLPDTTNAIQIDGVAPAGAFGVALLGIGKFEPSAGTTLIVTASLEGTSYAFGGHAPAGGVMTAAAADDSTVGSGTDRYGTPIAYLGPLGASPGAFALTSLPGQYVNLELGTAASGPFVGAAGSAPAPSVHFVNGMAGNSFGVIAIGGGVKGTSQVKSFIGDAQPDLILGEQGESGFPMYIINGSALTTLSGTVDVSAPIMATIPGIVKVSGKLPADWATGFTTGALVSDLDGDGYGDFAIGEASSAKPGRVAVFY